MPRRATRCVCLSSSAVAEVVVFHHSLGLTDSVRRFADALREAGHTVHTPDLYDGRTFATIEEGMAHAEELGFPMGIVDRGRTAAAELPADAFYVGFSLGVMTAQSLAQTKAGARGAVLVYAALPLGEWGDNWPAEWPEGVPLQIHMTEGDEDEEIAQTLVGAVPGAQLFSYPGSDHMFAEQDEQAASLLTQRVLEFFGS
jgi:dienelactone hydrolase